MLTFPSSHWAHTHEEWIEIEKTLLKNVSTEPLSLELECPHIVRAFLIMFGTLHRHTRHLSHPGAGLTLQVILDFVVDNEKFVALTNVVHNLEASGWALFPSISSVVDSYSEAQQLSNLFVKSCVHEMCDIKGFGSISMNPSIVVHISRIKIYEVLYHKVLCVLNWIMLEDMPNTLRTMKLGGTILGP